MPKPIKNQQIANEAADWAVRLDMGQLSNSENSNLAQWLLESPRHVEELLFAASIFSNLELVDSSNKFDINNLLQNRAPEVIPLLNKPGDSVNPKKNFTSFYALVSGIACSLILTLLWFNQGLFQKQITVNQNYITSLGEQRSISLDDGSVVHLNTKSEIEVNFTGPNRVIDLLNGEAIFEVKHDPERPFLVLAGTASAEAIGTTFNVYRKNDGVSVVVLEGKVAVANDQTNAQVDNTNTSQYLNDGRLLVSAGEKAQLEHNIAPLLVANVNIAAASSWRNRQLNFESDNLQDIAYEFNRYNRTQIIVQDSSLAQTQFSGVFNADDPESLISFLEYTGDMSIDRSQANIIRIRPKL